MSNHSENRLIDEDEIRAAMKPWRPNDEVFTAAVNARIDAKASQSNEVSLQQDRRSEDRTASGNSAVAASLPPIHLLLGATGLSSSKVSFAALSLVNKIFAVLAMPFACFLMVGLTVSGIMRINAAQNQQEDPVADDDKLAAATNAWWNRYGRFARLVFGVTLVAGFIGWTTPLLILLFGSGVVAVSLVVHLAKENLADRRAIGGSLVAGLGLVGQISGMFTRGVSEHWLDQHLVTAVLFGGAFLIAAVIGPPHFKQRSAGSHKRRRKLLFVPIGLGVVAMGLLAYLLNSATPFWGMLAVVIVFAAIQKMGIADRAFHAGFRITAVVIGLVVVGFLTQTLWRPLSTADVRSYAELFQDRRAASWLTLLGPAVWLQESEVEYDRAIPRDSFERDLETEALPRPFMLTIGVRTGLLNPKSLLGTPEVNKQRESLFNRFSVDNPITSIEQYYYAVAAISMDPKLSDSDRDFLASRLMATWEYICGIEDRFLELDRVLMVTELLERLDRPVDLERRTKDVHRWLPQMQQLEARFFLRDGGFRRYSMSWGCDFRSTIAALQLMDRYGAPDSIDWGGLRSYLRPSSMDRFLINESVLTKVGRDRLNALTDAPKPTVQGFLLREAPLWLAMLLVVLSVYATLSAPLPVEQAGQSTQ